MNKEEEINKLWHIYYAHLLKFPNKDKKTMTEGYPCLCTVCGWKGDSLQAIAFRYEDDEDGPYCPACWSRDEKNYCEEDDD